MQRRGRSPERHRISCFAAVAVALESVGPGPGLVCAAVRLFPAEDQAVSNPKSAVTAGSWHVSRRRRFRRRAQPRLREPATRSGVAPQPPAGRRPLDPRHAALAPKIPDCSAFRRCNASAHRFKRYTERNQATAKLIQFRAQRGLRRYAAQAGGSTLTPDQSRPAAPDEYLSAWEAVDRMRPAGALKAGQGLAARTKPILDALPRDWVRCT
jgi:hypothetical protein